jgi:hypothetical protein
MLHLYKKDWSRQELIRHTGQMDQIAGIRLLEDADGNESCSRLLEVWTGSGVSFNFLPDRAMDSSACQYKGMSLTWKSAIGDSHPAYYEPAGTGWLRYFQGGILVTCGLDTFGLPVWEGAEELGQHGQISGLPAREVGYQAGWVGQDYRLEASGVVHQMRVFGENLLLQRRISTSPGSNKIRIDDSVTNEGLSSHPHMLMYHINIGFPLLSQEAHFTLDAAETWTEDEASAKGLADWKVFQPPTPNFQEQNFFHSPVAGSKGWVNAELENPDLKLGLQINFNARTLPYLHEWKMMSKGSYILAIELMNCNLLGGRAAKCAHRTLPYLQPGESCNYALEIEVVEYE